MGDKFCFFCRIQLSMSLLGLFYLLCRQVALPMLRNSLLRLSLPRVSGGQALALEEPWLTAFCSWCGLTMVKSSLDLGGLRKILVFKWWTAFSDGEVKYRGYTQPTPYSGPVITMLPDTKVNSTYIKASFRCQVLFTIHHVCGNI